MAKTVLITGSNRGIGLALAAKYTEEGWQVIATARDVSNADELKALNPYKLLQLDTSDEASILRLANDLKDTPIDLLINNAGIAHLIPLESETKQTLLEQFEVNTIAPFLVTRALRPNLKLAANANATATVAQISSFVGSITLNAVIEGVPVPAGGIYGYRASKTALNMVTKSLSHDLKDDKIIAAALHPGYVQSGMTKDPRAMTPKQSAESLIKVISGLAIEDSGKFINYDGAPLPW